MGSIRAGHPRAQGLCCRSVGLIGATRVQGDPASYTWGSGGVHSPGRLSVFTRNDFWALTRQATNLKIHFSFCSSTEGDCKSPGETKCKWQVEVAASLQGTEEAERRSQVRGRCRGLARKRWLCPGLSAPGRAGWTPSASHAAFGSAGLGFGSVAELSVCCAHE